MKHRRFHRRYARLNGYFWLPCPLCGQEFGGHEWRDLDGKVSSIPDPERGPNAGTRICPDCTIAGCGYWGPVEVRNGHGGRS